MNYDWEQLGTGVRRCRLPFCDVTVGLVTGRDGTLLVDSGTTLAEAAAIAADIGAITDRSVTHVVLTHKHFDHVLGSSAFAGAEIHCAPEVVEKWELTPDGSSWIYHIHKGIKFHNGEDLKADDVKFSLDLYCSEDANYSDLRNAIERVEIVDDYTVRVYTNGPQPFLPQMSSWYPPAERMVTPKDYIEQNGMDYFKQKIKE